MRSIIIFIFFFVLIFAEFANAQAPDWQWAVQSQSATPGAYIDALGICNDTSGNMYLLGKTVSVFHIEGGILKSDTSRVAGTFIVKYDRQGKAIWVRQVGDSSTYPAAGIALDSIGNCYVFALSLVTANLGNGHSLGYGAFVIKYDGNGNIQWVKNISNRYINPYAMAIDKFGSIYITGSFHDTTDFQKVRLYDSTSGCIFLAKLDNAGSVVWAKSFNGLNRSNYCVGTGLSIDDAAETSTIYLLGDLNADSAYFDGNLVINHNASPGYNVFLARLNNLGNVDWVKTGRGNNHGSYNSATGWGICSDHHSKIYITGAFDADSGFFDVSSLHTVVNGNSFIAKFNSTGATEWIRINSPVPGPTFGKAFGYGIAVDNGSNVYASGAFAGGVNFSGESLEDGFWMNTNSYVECFDSLGKEKWIQRSKTDQMNAGIGASQFTWVAVYGGCPYLYGAYAASLTFGNTTLIPFDSNGVRLLYLAKISNTPSSVHLNSKSTENPLSIFPNPASTQATLNFVLEKPGIVNLEILDLLGRQVKKMSFGERSVGGHSETLDLQGWPNGSYLCRMSQSGEVYSMSFTVVK